MRATISCLPEGYETLKGIAKKKQVSLAWVVREATEKYIEDKWPLFGDEGRSFVISPLTMASVVESPAQGMHEGKRPHTVAELFCGCGGLSHGFGCLRCLLLVMCTYPFAKKSAYAPFSAR